MNKFQLFNFIEIQLVSILHQKQKPVRVAINGIEGTGKTCFANELQEYLSSKENPVIHVSIDGFHYNKTHRYKQGKDSALGYYQDAYDENSFTQKVLLASQQEPPTITTATHDLETDEYLNLAPIEIPKNTILITDGAYLFKSTYLPHWDFKVYLKTDFETAQDRGIKRDAELLGGIELAKEKYINRYHLASKIYIEENNPESIADLLIDNTNYDNPEIIHFVNE